MATQQQLEEARTAYHRLMTQGGIAELQHGDKRMRFELAKAEELAEYIKRLEGELSQAPRRSPSRRVLF